MDTEQLLQNKIPCAETGIEIKKTICAICEGPGSSCGINAYVKDGKVIKVEGNPDFEPSGGVLCSKGNANRQFIYNKERILTPLKRTGPRGSGEFTPISWDEAYDTIAAKMLEYKKDFGPESVAFGIGFTKWLRPFARRFALSYGSPNLVTESSTCFLATTMAGSFTYGQWFGPPDFFNTKCLLIWSSNFMHSDTSTSKLMLMLKAQGVKMIEVGPMITPFSHHADLHLRLRPGTDGALALGIAHVLIKEKLYDEAFIRDWTHGFEEYKAYVEEFTPERTAEITGVPAKDIIAAARIYGETEGSSIYFSASPTVHHTNGVQNHRAILILAGLSGNWDRKGGNVFEPEAWQHISAGFPTRQDEFIGVERMADMAPPIGHNKFPLWAPYIGEAHTIEFPYQIESGQPYPLKAFIGFGFNYRMVPANDWVVEQLKKLDFIVNMDLFMTDTCKLADIVLPVCSSFERSELKMYPGNYMMLSQPIIEPVGESKSDVEIVFDLAQRVTPEDEMLGKGFKDGYEACLDWIFEPSGMTMVELKKHSNGVRLHFPPPAYEKYKEKGFNTPTGKMEFTSEVLRQHGHDPLPVYKEPLQSPIATPELAKDFPLVLGTGSRVPSLMHSRTFRNSWDLALMPRPVVVINSVDAEARGIKNGDPVILKNPRAQIEVYAEVADRIIPGAVNIYHGWSGAEVNWLIPPDYQDPISGYPGYKSLLCEVVKR